MQLNAVAWAPQPTDSVSAEVAKGIMKLADKMSHNSQLSVTEMDTFLRGTPYEAFVTWMMMNNRHNFRRFDRDHDGAIVQQSCNADHPFAHAQFDSVTPAKAQEELAEFVKEVWGGETPHAVCSHAN